MASIETTANQPLKRVLSSVVAAMLLLSSGGAVAEKASGKNIRQALGISAPELHTSPNIATPAHGLRETAPEEVRGCERLNNRTSNPRFSSSLFHDYGLAASENAHAAITPLLRVDYTRGRAKLLSLAHINLSARYPIPPPVPSV